MKLARPGGIYPLQLSACPKRPTDPGRNLGRLYAGVQRGQLQLAANGIGLQHGLVSDDPRWATSWHPKLAAAPAPASVTRAGDKVHPLRKHPAIQTADYDGALRVYGDLRCPTATGEPDRRVRVVPNDGGVDVAEAVDLGAAHEAHLNAAVMEEALE